MSAAVISLQNIGKAYRMWDRPAARLISPVAETLAGLLPGPAGRWFGRKAGSQYRDFWALRDVSFDIRKGETVGIIGRNGSGKSTLLQIIAGTLQPSTGTVQVRGRVAALLELGAGFNPEFTGRENVYLNGAVLGLTKQEISLRFEDIIAFADIGEFIDQPVKTYSSGMLVRLAFAVQTVVEPDVLIVDEALSVGDFFFQQKCFRRLHELRTRGTSLLFVSHDMASVRDLCQRTLYLRQGVPVHWGDTQQAITRYFHEGNAPAETTSPTAGLPAPAPPPREDLKDQALWWNNAPRPTGPASLLGLLLNEQNGQAVRNFRLGQKVIFKIFFQAQVRTSCHVALEIRNRRDELVHSGSSYTCGLPPFSVQAGEVACFELTMDFNFEAGAYTFQAVLASAATLPNRSQRLDESPWLGPVEVRWDYENERAPFLGMFGPPVQARFIANPPHVTA